MGIEYLRLRSGDELFGEREDAGGAMVRLGKPWRLLLSPKGYVPMPMSLENLVVSEDDVLLSGKVDAELAIAHRAHSGGLVTPPEGLVVSVAP